MADEEEPPPQSSDRPKVVPFKRGRKAAKGGKYLSIQRALSDNALTHGCVAFDSFSRVPMLMRPIPHPDQRLDPDFKPRPLADADFVALVVFLESLGFEKLSPGVMRDVIGMELQNNQFSPPADLIRSLKWDGVPRLSTFFLIYAGVRVEGEDQAQRDRFRRYVEKVTRCTFIGVVARVMEPGCKVDTITILEGLQGTLKSSLLRKMALRAEWFSDNMPHDLAGKDARQHLPGKLIIELAEISSLKKSETEATKAFLSCQVDRYRPSYGHLEISWPRQNVFIGTTNVVDDYLTDTTGNRRFWPLKTTDIELDNAEAVMEQIYAEAFVAYQAGEQWWLDAETENVAAEQQEDRLMQDPWLKKIADIVDLKAPMLDDPFQWVSTAEALEACGVKHEHRGRAEEMRAGTILRQLGGVRKRRRLGDAKWVWAYRFGMER